MTHRARRAHGSNTVRAIALAAALSSAAAGGCGSQTKSEETDTDECAVSEGDLFGEPPGECVESAPLDSFEPDLQWSWDGPDGETSSIVTPLVANLTDDNEDGAIDLCDIPDLVVAASGSPTWAGHLYVLDGASGELHFRIEHEIGASTTPALGDIDGDGLIEIITAQVDGHLVAFENDGTLKWVGADWAAAYGSAVALADLDADGDVEIVTGNMVSDHQGTVLWIAAEEACPQSATAVADLDGDGDQEVVLGHAAYNYKGGEHWLNEEIEPGYPQIADLDGDGRPEVLVTNISGISVLEHDGSTKLKDLRPTGEPASGLTWRRPATVHDFDGDGEAEFAVSSASSYSVYEADASIVWSAGVSDETGIAAGTAFDFLGDGTAEAMYADEQQLFVFDDGGGVLLEMPRTSTTLIEYPVVADVDDDGSAEIAVVSNQYEGPASPTLQIIRDVDERWIQARRIWNQHTYHVTNVREDGTIPQEEPPSWAHLNTFRTNSQIEHGAVCDPVPVE